jgi:hypothetical protein
MPTRRRILIVVAAILVVAGAVATGASAAIVTSHDNQGRTITFDVRASNVNVEWYAAVLRASAHGNEISSVTIRVVPQQQIATLCGDDALACYTGRAGPKVIIVPAGQSSLLEYTLLHEYGHHLDTAWHVSGVPELNGTPVWWNMRGMAARLAAGQVAFDYSKGWDHSIAEIFAEDYAYIHVGAGYGIRWLSPPDDALKTALLNELGGASTSPLPPAVNQPLVITRNGTLAPRGNRVVRFGLLGPGRHVTLNATVTKAARTGTRARVQIVCNGSVLASGVFGKGRAQRTLDVPSAGPADCQARLVSTSSVSLGYTLRLRLAVES